MKKVKGLSDVKRKPDFKIPPGMHVFNLPTRSPFAHIEGETPDQAKARGVSYNGPVLAEKGLRDGACNRTACQISLKGMKRWSMDNHKGGRVYYCIFCADIFNRDDFRFGHPRRCSVVEGDE